METTRGPDSPEEYLCYTDGIFENGFQYAVVLEPEMRERIQSAFDLMQEQEAHNLWLPIKWIRFDRPISEKAGPLRIKIAKRIAGHENDVACSLYGAWESPSAEATYQIAEPIEEDSEEWKTATTQWQELRGLAERLNDE